MHAFRIALLVCLFANSVQVNSQCGPLLKRVSFEQASDVTETVIPYTETLAYHDWAPYSYLDGFYDDPSTIGSDNKRATLIRDNSTTHLRVKLPAGCVKSECAMQTKSALIEPVDEATLKFSVRFGRNFEWVKGGKLPGLCGGSCLTGCKQVTGLDGFSSRHMWRPCAWPPSNREPCSGGRLVAYVYHMFKTHWCGDDLMFEDFEPMPETWYTIWSHVRMNDAGPPTEAPRFERNGVLETWIKGPEGFAWQVVDATDMAWRQYTNVSIDTLYFSVFFGGSSRTFAPSKDESIDFSGFDIVQGRCTPNDTPLPSNLKTILPTWPGQAPSLAAAAPATTIATTLVFTKMFVGGACVDLNLRNTAEETCAAIEVDIGIRPSWGRILTRENVPSLSQMSLLSTESGGLYRTAVALRRELPPGGTDSRASFCVMNYAKTKYLPDDMSAHVIATATCTTRKTPVVRLEPPPPAPVPVPNSNLGSGQEQASSWPPGARPTSCDTPEYRLAVSATPDEYTFCIDINATYVGQDTCYEFEGFASVDPAFADLQKKRGVFGTRAPVTALDRTDGSVSFASPAWYERSVSGQSRGEPYATSLCGWYTAMHKGRGASVQETVAAFTGLRISCTRCAPSER